MGSLKGLSLSYVSPAIHSLRVILEAGTGAAVRGLLIGLSIILWKLVYSLTGPLPPEDIT